MTIHVRDAKALKGEALSLRDAWLSEEVSRCEATIVEAYAANLYRETMYTLGHVFLRDELVARLNDAGFCARPTGFSKSQVTILLYGEMKS